ncbi:MAG: O-antigen ligase family protein [Flavobacteriales bacterium]|nr:O-antigen ligase family protein [Flavobacteriales bacterium]
MTGWRSYLTYGNVQWSALALVAAALPWNNVAVSNAQFLLIGAWLAEGVHQRDLWGRFRRAFTDRWALLFISIFLLHVIGLFWTQDLEWGLDLCRILLPILVFGTILPAMPALTERGMWGILLTGAYSVVLSTVACMLLAHDRLALGDYRGVSMFISHIRLGLLLCMAVAVLVVHRPGRKGLRVLQLLAVSWALAFMWMVGSLSGAGALMATAFALGWWRAGMLTGTPRWVVRGTLVGLLAAGAWSIIHLVTDGPPPRPLDPEALPERSVGGERYYHDPQDPQSENGHYVWIEVADRELERGWSRASKVPFLGRDRRGQPLRSTLVRYLASMGTTKDSVGLAQLTPEDVRRIEAGVSDVRTGRRGLLLTRIDQLRMELDRYRVTGDPNGHSLTMRFEFWRTGLQIAREHLWTGVGTGDTRPAFAEMYDRTGSRLALEWRHRAHNEYLTLLISFGVFGMLWAVLAFLLPAWGLKAYRAPVFIAWAAIFTVSCLTEDTIETQVGATFFAFYYALLVFGARRINAERPPRSTA